MKGIFITFEGIDGCGKSTQCEMLKEYLKDNNKDFIFVREPGGTVIGERIREILLDKKNTQMTARTELLLFEAARAQITDEVIKPALEEGKIVLCDRFFDSSSAYQGMARNMGMDFVAGLNMAATGGLKPDVTFFFDITVPHLLRHSKKPALMMALIIKLNGLSILIPFYFRIFNCIIYLYRMDHCFVVIC